MATAKRVIPEKDPYSVLGLDFGVTDAAISKAYRQLARTLHPDKLVAQNLTPAQLTQSAVRFQEIQTARSFLLDADHAASRRKYDIQLSSDRVRQAANKQRDDVMTERRKRLRDELNQREAQASSGAASTTRKGFKSQPQHTSSSTKAATKEAVSTGASGELDRQGRVLREQYAAKAAATELRAQDKAATLALRRQIRLKWSRKKIKAAGDASPSEDSIAKMLTREFGGDVEAVQMIGDKGNIALVTFRSESSCTKAVTLYMTSDTWRATYVCKERQQNHDESLLSASRPSPQHQRDQENVHEWKARQAMERENLLRRMEREDSLGNATTSQVTGSVPRQQRTPFPPPFPDEYSIYATAIEKLERAENNLLRGLVSNEILQGMKVA